MFDCGGKQQHGRESSRSNGIRKPTRAPTARLAGLPLLPGGALPVSGWEQLRPLRTPAHPARSQQTLGVQALQRPREAETQSASREPPLTGGLREINKTGKVKSPLLCPAINTARFPARIQLSCKGQTSRMQMRGAALVALLLWWVWMVQSVGLCTRAPFPPLLPWQPSTANTSP